MLVFLSKIWHFKILFYFISIILILTIKSRQSLKHKPVAIVWQTAYEESKGELLLNIKLIKSVLSSAFAIIYIVLHRILHLRFQFFWSRFVSRLSRDEPAQYFTKARRNS